MSSASSGSSEKGQKRHGGSAKTSSSRQGGSSSSSSSSGSHRRSTNKSPSRNRIHQEHQVAQYEYKLRHSSRNSTDSGYPSYPGGTSSGGAPPGFASGASPMAQLPQSVLPSGGTMTPTTGQIRSGHIEVDTLYGLGTAGSGQLTVNAMNAPNNSTMQCGCDNIDCPFCNLMMSVQMKDSY